MPTDDLESRVTSLEHELGQLREQVALTNAEAAAARVLAAGADRDVSEVRAELRAHTQGLSALRETQLEQGRDVTGLRHEVTSLRHEVTDLRQEMRQGFATLGTGMAQITALLTNLEDQDG